jgi:hypothetical protein
VKGFAQLGIGQPAYVRHGVFLGVSGWASGWVSDWASDTVSIGASAGSVKEALTLPHETDGMTAHLPVALETMTSTTIMWSASIATVIFTLLRNWLDRRAHD